MTTSGKNGPAIEEYPMSSAALTNSFVMRSFPSAVSIPLKLMTGIFLCGAILLVWRCMQMS